MPVSAIETLPPLREVIARHKLMARKSLGQHFLCDLNLTRKIADCAGNLERCVVFEIGAGPGGLTRALLGTNSRKVIAVEKDPRCVAALSDLKAAAGNQLEVIEGDALEIDLAALEDAPRAIVANLPYNVGTELLLRWLRSIDAYQGLTLMFQSEVADRLAAQPHSKTYGRLSVITQFCCHVRRVLNVPARAFTPAPKVDSAVVHLTPRSERPSDVAFEAIESLTAAAFGQRRKMLRSSLKGFGGEALLHQAGINPELRAENLAVADFVALARLIKTGT